MKYLSLIKVVLLAAIISSCSKEDVEIPTEYGKMSFSINTGSTGLKNTNSANSLGAVTHAIVSIEKGGSVFQDYELKKIKVSDWGSSTLVSDEIKLWVGDDYQLVRFELQNKDNKTLYAAPMKGSSLAAKVSKPLAIDFQVKKDKTTPLKVEVLSTEGASPADFGFVQFNVKVVSDTDENMIFVKGGTFKLVVPTEASDNSDKDITYQITLDDFQIGKYEVTQAQWIKIMGTKPKDFIGGNYPVVNVTKEEVLEFIEKLNAISGESYRLPTEAEWFYAARGGSNSKNYLYSGSNDLDKVAWTLYNSEGKAHEVGKKLANELGLHDMSGNVMEYCSDTYEKVGVQLEYDALVLTNPENKKGDKIVTRGGCFLKGKRDFFRLDKFAHYSTTVGIGINRILDNPGNAFSHRGFRLVKNN